MNEVGDQRVEFGLDLVDGLEGVPWEQFDEDQAGCGNLGGKAVEAFDGGEGVGCLFALGGDKNRTRIFLQLTLLPINNLHHIPHLLRVIRIRNIIRQVLPWHQFLHLLLRHYSLLKLFYPFHGLGDCREMELLVAFEQFQGDLFTLIRKVGRVSLDADEERLHLRVLYTGLLDLYLKLLSSKEMLQQRPEHKRLQHTHHHINRQLIPPHSLFHIPEEHLFHPLHLPLLILRQYGIKRALIEHHTEGASILLL